MLIKLKKCFTLVEVLVALAVSSIAITAAYSSYQLVADQYAKNTDLSDMHATGRSIMAIIKRDIRMAGFEYRDDNGVKVNGGIPNPLVIKDSGNACCDSAEIIYDYYDEYSKKLERRKISYYTKPYSNNKGNRNRLYKKVDILDKSNSVIRAGSEQPMADFIEDFQLFNVDNSKFLYVADANYLVSSVDIVNKKKVTTVKTDNPGIMGGRPNSGMTIGANGLLYAASSDHRVLYIDPDEMKVLGSIRKNISGYARPSGGITSGPDGLLYLATGSGGILVIDPMSRRALRLMGVMSGIANCDVAFGPNGLLYAGTNSLEIMIIDTKQNKQIGIIDKGINYRPCGGLAFGPNGLLYAGTSSDKIMIIDTVQKKVIGTIEVLGGRPNYYLAFDSDGILYAGSDSDYIMVIDPILKKRIGTISNIGHRTSAGIAFRGKNTGSESLVELSLVIRSKNPHQAQNKIFKKTNLIPGNFSLSKNDKYLRETFHSTIVARNMSL